MRAPLAWLGDFVGIDVPVETLAEMLSLSGTKVESVDVPGGSVRGVVVAEVLDIRPHPNADNLTLVEVGTGGETERVVCGARNFEVGDRVPFATVGAELVGMRVDERKIRGEASRGMLCSGAELGVSRDHSGILVLPADAGPGDDVGRLLGLGQPVLQLEITPNRPDCMGMIGIAREIAALLGSSLEVPPAVPGAGAAKSSPVEVEVADPQGCPRYVARYLDGVSVAPSPAWLSARLLAAGVRPISNAVDVTNYVMLETGQPLHAFDARRVAERRIVVRKAADGEHLVTLDGVDRRMTAADLMIADPLRPLAIAGVMGGEGSEVDAGTHAVILESAYFDPASIGRTSRRHGVRTEASARFERGVDFEAQPYAAARAAQVIAELSGGESSPAVVDVYPAPIARRRVELRPGRTSAYLGYDIALEAQAGHLSSIGFGVRRVPAGLVTEVPSWRPDIAREEDLIEEVARLAGFDKLPSTLPPGAAGGLEPRQAAERRLKRTLVAHGVHEAWTPSFGNEAELDRLGLEPGHPARAMVALANPMSEDESMLRSTLLPGLLKCAARNLAHRVQGAALFEVARVYRPSDGRLPHEPLTLGAVLTGNRYHPGWRVPAPQWDFFAAKGVLETALAGLGCRSPGWSPVGVMPWHPTRAAEVSVGELELGTLGELHPDVCERFDVTPGTVALELSLEALLARSPGRIKVVEPPRFPPVYIDVALVVDADVPAGTVEVAAAYAGAPEVASLRLFDVYTGAQVPEGKKSLAFALELRAPDRTLTDEEAVAVRDRMVAALRDEVGAELRG